MTTPETLCDLQRATFSGALFSGRTVLWLAVIAVLAHSVFAQVDAPLTNDDIIQMVKSGLSETVVITALKQSARSFDIRPQGLMRLRAAGVSNAIIEAMIAPVQSLGTPIASSSASQLEPSASGRPSAYGVYIQDRDELVALNAVRVITRVGLSLVNQDLGVGRRRRFVKRLTTSSRSECIGVNRRVSSGNSDW